MSNSEDLKKAVTVLKKGGVIIFPTDTVWGIGASIQGLEAVRRLYQIKRREQGKPTAVLVADISIASSLGVIGKEAELLINKFWPGSLTIVVKAKQTVPAEIMGRGKTVGLRQPDHPLALALLEKLQTGLVTASANFAGQPPPREKELINQKLVDQVDFLLEGKAGGKIPSTVLDTTVKPFKILRQGEITSVLPLDKPEITP